MKQMLDTAMHPIKAAEPFTIRNIERASKLNEPWEVRAESAFGVRGAPASANQTRAQRLAQELVISHIPVEGRTQAAADRRDAERQISRLAQQGQAYAEQARDFIRRGVLTANDVHKAALQARVPPLVREFNHLGIGDALRVWDAATPRERATLRPILAKKAATIKNLPADERDVLMPKLQQALRPERPQ